MCKGNAGPKLFWARRLFDRLENPENLEAFVEEQTEVVELQLSFLTHTLHVDQASLLENAECRDSSPRRGDSSTSSASVVLSIP